MTCIMFGSQLLNFLLFLVFCTHLLVKHTQLTRDLYTTKCRNPSNTAIFRPLKIYIKYQIKDIIKCEKIKVVIYFF